MSEQTLYPEYVWWLLPSKLAGMSRPPTEDLSQLNQAGLRGIVSVMDEPSGIEEYKKAGFKALWLPVTGGKPPTVEQVKQFVNFAQPLVANEQPVAVHCTSGNRRTGTLLAPYLVAQGAAPKTAMQQGLGGFPHERLHQEAIAMIKKARPSAELREAQQEFLRKLPELLG